MVRWACVSVAALPLQLLLRKERAWASFPVAVVNEDKPQGRVLWTNDKARAFGVLVGQNYAVALSLASGLRAAVVPEAEIDAAIAELKTELWRFSPNLEVGEEKGVFWLDAAGLGRLYPQLSAWAKSLRDRLFSLGFSANVVVGFSRFGTYAVARAARVNRNFESAEEERDALRKVPLVCLDIEPTFRDVLAKLGIHTVEALVSLPATGLLPRFGKEAYRIHQLASGELAVPFAPTAWLAPLEERAILDDAESDATRLLFILKRLLDALLPKLVLRGEALTSLRFTCKLDRSLGVLGPEELRPSVPTLDVVSLMDLLRLRIETLNLEAGVIEVELCGTGVAASPEQLRVFAEVPRRDLAAADRALARLRAELGEDAVVCAVVCPGHLPEAHFAWHPITQLRLPQPRLPPSNVFRFPNQAYEESASASLARRPLVRRVLAKPKQLSSPPRHIRDDGWLICGALYGPVSYSAGPYVVSGGWWMREVHREYHFMITRRGDLLWVYHDRRRRRFFLQGEVC